MPIPGPMWAARCQALRFFTNIKLQKVINCIKIKIMANTLLILRSISFKNMAMLMNYFALFSILR